MKIGTIVYPLLCGPAFDESLWSKPLKFSPERHLLAPLESKNKLMTFSKGEKISIITIKSIYETHLLE